MIAIAALATIIYIKMELRTNKLLHQNGREDKTRKGVIGYETVTPYVIGNLVSQGISTNTTPNITIKIT